MQTLASRPTSPRPGLLEDLFDSKRLPHPALVVAGFAALVAGVMLRFAQPGALWLDESISVNIAGLPLSHIPAALAHDGAPPLYYVMLHYWMELFGRSDAAVRALSGVISVLTLPVFYLAGRRLGGRTVGWVAFFLALSSPFAINYATSARMYSLMVLASLLGFLALTAAYQHPTRSRLLAVGAVTAALLYTHYWGVYLVLVTAGWLAWRIHRHGRGGPALRAMMAGAALWLPWAPVFVYQTLHTGTPWAVAVNPSDLLTVFGDWSGRGPWSGLLMFSIFLLFILGAFGRTAAPGTRVRVRDADGSWREMNAGPAVLVELRPRPGMAPLVAIAVGTLVVAVVLGAVAHAAFVDRYTAVVLPLFLLIMSTGLAVLPGRRFGAACLAVLVVAGLFAGRDANRQPRTQAVQVAEILNAQARPGDLVVYCPDQLGPAVDRLLRVPGLQQITFPRAIGPARVDWVDYRSVIDRTNVSQFAQDAVARAPQSATVWLVWRDGYAGFGGDCGNLQSWLNLQRGFDGVTLVFANSSFYEFENLTRYTGQGP